MIKSYAEEKDIKVIGTDSSDMIVFGQVFIDRDMVTEWDEIGLMYEFKDRGTEWWGYLLSMLPWILIIFLFLSFWKCKEIHTKSRNS